MSSWRNTVFFKLVPTDCTVTKTLEFSEECSGFTLSPANWVAWGWTLTICPSTEAAVDQWEREAAKNWNVQSLENRRGWQCRSHAPEYSGTCTLSMLELPPEVSIGKIYQPSAGPQLAAGDKGSQSSSGEKCVPVKLAGALSMTLVSAGTGMKPRNISQEDTGRGYSLRMGCPRNELHEGGKINSSSPSS